MGARRRITCICLVVLALAWAFRWEKTSRSKELISVTYLRDRWLGQAYVQSWGAAAYGGDGRGTAMPMFSSAETDKYIAEHMTYSGPRNSDTEPGSCKV